MTNRSQREPSAAFRLLSGSPGKLNSRLDQSFRNVDIKGVFYSALGGFLGATLGHRQGNAVASQQDGLFCVWRPSSKDLGLFHPSSEEASAHVLGEDEWMVWFHNKDHDKDPLASLRIALYSFKSYFFLQSFRSNTRVCARAHAQIQQSSNKQGQQWY